MAFSLSVSATYYRHGNVVDVPVTVVDSSTNSNRTDIIQSGSVTLLYRIDQQIGLVTFSRSNGANDGHSHIIFLNPSFIDGLSVSVSVTLNDGSTLTASIPVYVDNSIPTDETPLNPNAVTDDPQNDVL